MVKYLTAALILLGLGCANSGTMLRFEQRSVAGITSLTLADYTIPVVSIGSGPSFSLWQSRHAENAIEFEGYACYTNKTSALGIYQSEERKVLRFQGKARVSPTNTVNSIEAGKNER